MKGKRFLHTIALFLISSPSKRAEYLRNHHVFREIGDNCLFMDRVVPLYPNLIKLGNNVRISSNVRLVTHNDVHSVLNYYSQFKPIDEQHCFKESLGCIEIGNNCFIGVNSIITSNVKIGDNVVVSAGSIVLNDVPSNSVVRGAPAKRICTVDQLYDMMSVKPSYPDYLIPEMGSYVGKELEDWLWDSFNKARGNTHV